MDKRRVPVTLGQRGVDVLLAGRVGPEVDGPTGRDPHQVRAEAFEEPRQALM